MTRFVPSPPFLVPSSHFLSLGFLVPTITRNLKKNSFFRVKMSVMEHFHMVLVITRHAPFIYKKIVKGERIPLYICCSFGCQIKIKRCFALLTKFVDFVKSVEVYIANAIEPMIQLTPCNFADGKMPVLDVGDSGNSG